MAEMGPWTLLHIEVLDAKQERCERCSEPIRHVWIMEKRSEPKEVWRIGSTCGPALEEMTEELWEAVAKPYKRRIDYIVKLEKLVYLERDHPDCLPPDHEPGWADTQRAAVAAASTARDQRILKHRINQVYSLARAMYRRKVGS